MLLGPQAPITKHFNTNNKGPQALVTVNNWPSGQNINLGLKGKV